MGKRLTILDCNNLWTPDGGGIRRYHLQKITHYRDQDEIKHVFVMPDWRTFTELVGGSVVIEHVEAPLIPGRHGHRAILRAEAFARVLRRHQPDVISIGSPCVLPRLARLASDSLDARPAIVGFWHLDFPGAHAALAFRRMGPLASKAAESMAWRLARAAYSPCDAVFVASRPAGDRLLRHGLDRLFYVPLGVDRRVFTPERRDPGLVENLKAGHQERLTLLFPHRLCRHKGIDTLLAAYRIASQQLPVEPALVFAGHGPESARVEQAARANSHIHLLGHLEDPRELSRWSASCEAGLALSGEETFGLAALELIASGQLLIGADRGAVGEHIRDSGCGMSLPPGDVSRLAEILMRLASSSDRRPTRDGAAYAAQFSWTKCFERERHASLSVLSHVRAGARVPTGFHRILPS